MHYAARRGRDDLWEPFERFLAMVKDGFLDAEYGGWFGAYDPKRPGQRDGGSKGSVWKVGYHAGGMYAEALRLTAGVK